MTPDEIRAQIAEWKGKRSLPASIIAGNGWTPESLPERTCAAKRDGKWVQVPFLEWKSETEAEADAQIARLEAMLP